MKHFLLALFFALCVQNVNAEVSPIQSGDSSAASATNSWAHEDVITSSHPCRVVASSTTANIAGATGTATTMSATIAGSTITLNGWSGSTFLRVCAKFQITKSNNNASGIFGIGVMLDGTTWIGPTATSTVPLWSFDGNANAATIPYVGGHCWVHPTALSAASHWVALAIQSSDALDSTVFYGPTDMTNWFTMEEYTCKN